MKIAITDACIFIDIYDLQFTSKFFGLELGIHTSVDVCNELYNEHQVSAPYPRALYSTDKTVFFLQKKLKQLC